MAVPEQVPHLVHHGRQQIHALSGSRAVPRRQYMGAEEIREFHVIHWRRVDEPTVTGRIPIEIDLVHLGQAQIGDR